MNRTIDLQGHRGFRGLMPENTIPGFLKALEIGVSTLEMDLAVSADGQLIVSHEPYFSHEISTDPQGNYISEENELEHNIFKMPYAEIRKYDVGLRTHPRFPEQKKIAAFKPLLNDVILEVERAALQHDHAKPYYNIEIKRYPIGDEIYHPNAQDFAQLVSEVLEKMSKDGKNDLKERIIIQSFDSESLQAVRKIDPDLRLAFLVENNASAQQNLDVLGFTPEVYSPAYRLVNEELVKFCKKNSMDLIPWTVNLKQEMVHLIEFGVDGIITDYPNILKELLDSMKIEIKHYNKL
ncbi:MAG: glycerophosphodiester phosphodiesterase [Flavobacterium sp.]|nr:MAG: glycerophosphodiester phosphodiesterase [Flavobacterium sp.]